MIDLFVDPALLVQPHNTNYFDLTDVVNTRNDLKWLDGLLGFREHIAVYGNRNVMLPTDGDAHYLLYGKDIQKLKQMTS